MLQNRDMKCTFQYMAVLLAYLNKKNTFALFFVNVKWVLASDLR